MGDVDKAAMDSLFDEWWKQYVLKSHANGERRELDPHHPPEHNWVHIDAGRVVELDGGTIEFSQGGTVSLDDNGALVIKGDDSE